MELGELVDVQIPDIRSESECPFAHEQPKAELKNELGGIGTKLGDNLAKGIGVHTDVPPKGGDFTKCTAVPDPRDDSPKLTSIYIKVNGKTVALDGKDLPYPLTCAAHHLVPAQEALKKHAILRYMCKDGETQDFRSSGGPEPAAVQGSKVWGNVGYNVNGGNNGVWLPGNYAVGGGAGGVEIWKARSSDTRGISDTDAADTWIKAIDTTPAQWSQLSADPLENEQPQSLGEALATAALPTYMLAGTNYSIDDKNPKWAYVKAAMTAASGLFHDRHKPYSDEVKEYLEKIAESYATMFGWSTDQKNPCQDCEKAQRPAGVKATLRGPPYPIVGRLVTGSNFFKAFVKTKTVVAKNIYTSNWVLEWINTKP